MLETATQILELWRPSENVPLSVLSLAQQHPLVLVSRLRLYWQWGGVNILCSVWLFTDVVWEELSVRGLCRWPEASWETAAFWVKPLVFSCFQLIYVSRVESVGVDTHLALSGLWRHSLAGLKEVLQSGSQWSGFSVIKSVSLNAEPSLFKERILISLLTVCASNWKHILLKWLQNKHSCSLTEYLVSRKLGLFLRTSAIFII